MQACHGPRNAQSGAEQVDTLQVGLLQVVDSHSVGFEHTTFGNVDNLPRPAILSDSLVSVINCTWIVPKTC